MMDNLLFVRNDCKECLGAIKSVRKLNLSLDEGRKIKIVDVVDEFNPIKEFGALNIKDFPTLFLGSRKISRKELRNTIKYWQMIMGYEEPKMSLWMRIKRMFKRILGREKNKYPEGRLLCE